MLSFSWDLPILLGSEVVSYQVIVSRLAIEHRSGTKDVIHSTVYDHETEMKQVSVIGLGECLILCYLINQLGQILTIIVLHAAAEVPYSITVKALNLAGCGQELQIYCFTQEGGTYQCT